MTAYRSAERKCFIAGVIGPISSSDRSGIQKGDRVDTVVKKMRKMLSPTNDQMAFLDDKTGCFVI